MQDTDCDAAIAAALSAEMNGGGSRGRRNRQSPNSGRKRSFVGDNVAVRERWESNSSLEPFFKRH